MLATADLIDQQLGGTVVVGDDDVDVAVVVDVAERRAAPDRSALEDGHRRGT